MRIERDAGGTRCPESKTQDQQEIRRKDQEGRAVEPEQALGHQGTGRRSGREPVELGRRPSKIDRRPEGSEGIRRGTGRRPEETGTDRNKRQETGRQERTKKQRQRQSVSDRDRCHPTPHPPSTPRAQLGHPLGATRTTLDRR